MDYLKQRLIIKMCKKKINSYNGYYATIVSLDLYDHLSSCHTVKNIAFEKAIG